MKKYIIIIAALLVAASCDSYFDIDFQDQANLEEIFAKKNTTEKYLTHLYSYLPHDEDTHNGDGYVIPRSDEGLFGFLGYGPFNKLRSGDYSTAASGDVVQYNKWKTYYVAIRQCTIFMDHVHLDTEDSEAVKAAMKAEARFLRAFYYFCLFRQYGPVIIWGDQLAPEDAKGSELDRNTVDENVDFKGHRAGEVDIRDVLRASCAGAHDQRAAGLCTQPLGRLFRSGQLSKGQGKHRAHAGADALRIIKVRGMAGNDNPRSAKGVSGAEEGSQVSGGRRAVKDSIQRRHAAFGSLLFDPFQSVRTFTNKGNDLAALFPVGKVRMHAFLHLIKNFRLRFRDHILRPSGQAASVSHRHGGKLPVMADSLFHHLHAFHKGQLLPGAFLTVALERFKPLVFRSARVHAFDLHLPDLLYNNILLGL